mgnify:CR=1 FL=1
MGVQERALDYRKIVNSLAKGSHPEEHSVKSKFRAINALNFFVQKNENSINLSKKVVQKNENFD